MGAILGVSAFYHDSAAAVTVDGRIVAAAQEERFTRRKGDQRFPTNAIAYCLHEAGLRPSDLLAVAYYEKPITKFGRLLESFLAVAPRGLRSWSAAVPIWLRQRLWVEQTIRGSLGLPDSVPVLYPEHHESHAASAFFPSPYESAAVLTLDGVGEWATATVGLGDGSSLDLHEELRFPHSLGLLYSAFTSYLGFRVNSGEYKVMGLAPYGRPRHLSRLLEHVVDLRPDGSLRLDLDYFDFVHSKRMTSRRMHELLGGPPREPGSEITQRHMDVARSVQEVVESAMLRMARHAHRMSRGVPRLCLAGGVALNSVGNGRILREGPFDAIWIQPAAGDAGGALGAALAAWHLHFGRGRVPATSDAMEGAGLGPSFSGEEIERALRGCGAVYERLDRGEVVRHTARLLAHGHVVGWFQGRMEFGPRALGNRSILADPRSPEMQRVLNAKVKFRESFRPFAPAVLAEDAGEYFDLDAESPYMLLVAKVREEIRRRPTGEERGRRGLDLLGVPRSTIPAVTHVDHSSRVQTVSREDGLFHGLIREFKRITGCGVLVNTSMNVSGEPIVCRPEEAYRCMMATQMDAVVIGECLLLRADQSADGEAARKPARSRRPLLLA